MTSYIPIIIGIILAFWGLSKERGKIGLIILGLIIAAIGLYIPTGTLPF